MAKYQICPVVTENGLDMACECTNCSIWCSIFIEAVFTDGEYDLKKKAN